MKLRNFAGTVTKVPQGRDSQARGRAGADLCFRRTRRTAIWHV
ncbi:hypothetical protein ACFFX0_10820 [Citricoccus parietis]|uniref:Uncharacterized protein n=1 Tax=Citricoccus parietis TaxID=592307 RepID=A0ABV5FYA1_9MICC